MQTYEPDVVIYDSGIHHRHRGRHHRLHDDLALLLSTSGSAGSPKLVRLSRSNLVSNAAAIAEYLGIREADGAATTLPMSYCYGLSVVHSHLLRGAGLVLTDHSVVDDEFWKLFRRHRGTALAGVPYTFELLERLGAETLDLPHLRYVTQAGGQMPPERVRRFAELGLRQGWELFVMYGSTEATARMAYLPA
jgi:acyl-coenzyme A synthetase/AMP-(fatty) acid ligase